MHALVFETQPLILSLPFIVRASPAVPDLAPVKALKLRTSLATGRHSERAPRAVASAAATGEPSCATTVLMVKTRLTFRLDSQVYKSPMPFFTYGRSQGLSIHGARGLLALNQALI
jgi:hypothetical protein